MLGRPDRRPEPVNTKSGGVVDQEYDYVYTPTPTTASASGLDQNSAYGQRPAQYDAAVSVGEDTAPTSEEALLMDLAHLEEVHEEAERMKLLGNKRMANQEFAAAYNAYSQALQLSPVGPSSHVFLSNRAAALLSLKKYESAATDAKRAVALAPTFGKAHARLGQALYFLRRYDEAIEAYKDALEFEPDNDVTRTYLQKAIHKMERETKSRASNHSDWESIAWQDSVATDPHGKHTVVSKLYHPTTAQRAAVLSATTAKRQDRTPTATHNHHHSPDYVSKTLDRTKSTEETDPEFFEAVRIQQRANSFLVQKKYKSAIEEYTAALFLVPDDPQLSPDLHLGRAHALNGSRRHDAARNDALLAIKLAPSPAAYSTLAKTLFYLKDYQGCIDAFRKCENSLPKGEMLGSFDTAYYEKALRMLNEDIGSIETPKSKSIPKLPPPRFVPREQAMSSPANAVRSLPKSWPQQTLLQTGVERTVMCLSESLGVKLNRGPDGIVRVLTVTDDGALRQGEVYPGDVVRAAAGVDLRRPITNVMWGDTVALIKMATRPIFITVAQELSERPQSVIDEQRKAMSPSNASDDRAVGVPNDKDTNEDEDDIVEILDTITDDIVEVLDESILEDKLLSNHHHRETGLEDALATIKESAGDEGVENDALFNDKVDNNSSNDVVKEIADAVVANAELSIMESAQNLDEQMPDGLVRAPIVIPIKEGEKIPAEINESNSLTTITPVHHLQNDIIQPTEDVAEDDSITSLDESHRIKSEECEDKEINDSFDIPQNTLRNEETKIVGGEILFRRDAQATYQGWDTLRWMAYNGVRKVNLCQTVFRRSTRKGLPVFWKSGFQYDERALIVYDQPNLLFIARRPSNLEEIQNLLGLSDEPESEEEWALNSETALQSYWIVESVADPTSSKLRLSPLTTATSGIQYTGDRERSCFQILTPAEEIVLSAILVRPSAKSSEQSYTDSVAFLETLSIESSIAKSICTAQAKGADLGNNQRDIAWKHQLILGSLHSLVISGNIGALKDGLDHARQMYGNGGAVLPPRIIDAVDDNGYTALYYACSLQMAGAIEQLVLAGADIDSQLDDHGFSMLHIAARRLDDKSIINLLSSPKNPNANVTDKRGRTPLYVAIVEGSVCDQRNDPSALDRCIIALEAKGGTISGITTPTDVRHPVSALAYMWLHRYLAVLLKRTPHRFPLVVNGTTTSSSSVGALYQYPLHCAIIALRKTRKTPTQSSAQPSKFDLLQTITLLLDHGFEPNERIDPIAFGDVKTSLDEFAGYSPLQILAVVALEMDAPQSHAPTSLSTSHLVQQVAKCLVENGARTSLDPPIPHRQRHLPSTRNESVVNILTTKIDSDALSQKVLGGKDVLDSSSSVWHFMKKIPKSFDVDLLDEKAAIADTSTAGGSDSLSCAICWSVFGTMTNRRHRCRISSKYICNDCSTKRLVDGKNEHRISDGQFLLAKADSLRQQQRHVAPQTTAVPSPQLVVPETVTSSLISGIRRDRLNAEKSELENRDRLFGGIIDAASNYVFGADGEQNSGVLGLTASLGQTRDALHQRGERLASLSDKSSQMVDASADFAKMAKELRKQSESGFFW